MAQGKLVEPTPDDRKQVEALSGYGVPMEQIAVLVCGGIDRDTLSKHFKDELISGKAKANVKIGQTLFQKAVGGDTTAMIWWSKTKMRWSETQVIDHTSTDGSMTPAPAINIDKAEMKRILKELDDEC
jgi:hypothetical protein